MQIREAIKEDLPVLVEMLADDPLGQKRERYELPLPDSYYRAFDTIHSDPHQHLLCTVDGDKIIGMLQLSIITYLTYRGGSRAQIEGVRTHKEHRGQGIGKKMILRAIEIAREMDCHLVQLTTDKKRPEALAFYKNIGFVDSHEGMKLHF